MLWCKASQFHLFSNELIRFLCYMVWTIFYFLVCSLFQICLINQIKKIISSQCYTVTRLSLQYEETSPFSIKKIQFSPEKRPWIAFCLKEKNLFVPHYLIFHKIYHLIQISRKKVLNINVKVWQDKFQLNFLNLVLEYGLIRHIQESLQAEYCISSVADWGASCWNSKYDKYIGYKSLLQPNRLQPKMPRKPIYVFVKMITLKGNRRNWVVLSEWSFSLRLCKFRHVCSFPFGKSPLQWRYRLCWWNTVSPLIVSDIPTPFAVKKFRLLRVKDHQMSLQNLSYSREFVEWSWGSLFS